MTDRDLSVEELDACCDQLDAWLSECSPATFEKFNGKFCRLVAAARRSLEAGWQPIETAPRDGGAILVLQNKVRAVVGFSRMGGYWQVLPCDPGAHVNPMWPTHWQPLPSPPNSETESEVMPSADRSIQERNGRRVAQPSQDKCEPVAAPAPGESHHIVDADKMMGESHTVPSNPTPSPDHAEMGKLVERIGKAPHVEGAGTFSLVVDNAIMNIEEVEHDVEILGVIWDLRDALERISAERDTWEQIARGHVARIEASNSVYERVEKAIRENVTDAHGRPTAQALDAIRSLKEQG